MKTWGCTYPRCPPGSYTYALRLLLRPFWDKSRAVVAVWLAEYCVQVLYRHLPSQVTSNFHEKRYYGWQNSIVGGDSLEERLVNS